MIKNLTKSKKSKKKTEKKNSYLALSLLYNFQQWKKRNGEQEAKSWKGEEALNRRRRVVTEYEGAIFKSQKQEKEKKGVFLD